MVEEGWTDNQIAKLVVNEYIKDLKNIDALVLGCTHYPLLRPIIQNVMGQSVKLIDSGAETVHDISVLLNYFEINRNRKQKEAQHHFYTTASPKGFKEIAEQWMGRKITVEHIDL